MTLSSFIRFQCPIKVSRARATICSRVCRTLTGTGRGWGEISNSPLFSAKRPVPIGLDHWLCITANSATYLPAGSAAAIRIRRRDRHLRTRTAASNDFGDLRPCSPASPAPDRGSLQIVAASSIFQAMVPIIVRRRPARTRRDGRGRRGSSCNVTARLRRRETRRDEPGRSHPVDIDPNPISRFHSRLIARGSRMAGGACEQAEPADRRDPWLCCVSLGSLSCLFSWLSAHCYVLAPV